VQITVSNAGGSAARDYALHVVAAPVAPAPTPTPTLPTTGAHVLAQTGAEGVALVAAASALTLAGGAAFVLLARRRRRA